MGDKDDNQRFSSRHKNEKIKSRNLSEKKRRDQFNVLVNELSCMVPSTNHKMDKSSILRAAILFLRSHNECSVQSSHEVQENWKPSFLSNGEFTHIMLEAISGFIVVLSSTGKILYSSESMASLLGYLSGQMCSSIFDMVHECDQASLYKLLSGASSSTDNCTKDLHFSRYVHIKRGPLDSLQHPVYELVHLGGMFHPFASYSEGCGNSSFDCDSSSYSSSCSPVSSTTGTEWNVCFVAIAKLQPPQLLHVINLPEEHKKEFTSRHSLEWTFLFLDYRAAPIIGYLPFEVLGTSGYEYYHVDDLEKIVACHEALIRTGEGMSCIYRFLTKGQQWIWVQTRYYITYHQWNSKPEFVVCTHSVVDCNLVQDNLFKWPSKNEDFTSGDIICSQADVNSSSTKESSHLVSELPMLLPENLVLDAAAGSLEGKSSEGCRNPDKFESGWDLSSQQITQSESTTETKESSSNQLFTVQPTFYQIPSILPILAQETSHTAQTAAVVTTTSTAEPMFGPSELLLTTNAPHEQCQTAKMPELQPASTRTPNQSHLRDYLKRRHQVLQEQIIIHQKELRRVSEQLKLVQSSPYPTADTSSLLAAASISHPDGETVPQPAAMFLLKEDDGKCTLVPISDQQHLIAAALLKRSEGGVGVSTEAQGVPSCVAQEHSQLAEAIVNHSQHPIQ